MQTLPLVASAAGRLPPPPPDVLAAQTGDRRALERLLTEHWGAIERMCRRMCLPGESFEDLRQDVFIALIRALPGYRGQASFLTWTYTIIRTCRGRRLRRRRPDECVATDERDEAAEATADYGESHARTQSLDRALAKLAALDRRVLVMRDLEGWSASEVARATGLTVPAVKTRLHRARAAMRGLLGGD